ncbi:hypothetical protein DKG77_01725 [Flagellimonas aquimarina]|uniref:Uncharacterized protein n=1 Tax=Flagellimonas aquimarina TaxID=2201895 RepID=A0A316L3T3_9FLAO|nr:carbohydrate binding family 9 domain-containing protein [Allomuricauda koreensis]PWL39579.1 hypothetical protein DKG77_01725 [Allomuricauda koreensis]
MRNTVTLTLLCIVVSLNGQTIFEPPIDKISVSATFTGNSVKIDGELTETAWEEAKVLTNFIQIEPNQGETSQFNTFVRVLYDEQNLYIGAFCEDLEGKKGVRVPDLARDFSFRTNDTFAIGIDGFLDERNSITIATNPYGTQKDYLSFDDTFFDARWNGLWKVRTSITDKGWYAEFQIPWKTLRYNETGDTSSKWGINFVRQRRKSNEISAWSPYPRAYGFNRSEYFGWLMQVKPKKPSTNIQINPYILSEYIETKENGETQTSENNYTIGGELKWALNTNTLMDLTFNTDFAQAEADRQVNNISRFSVFFPERRQFFLENASLFGAGLYSDTGGSGNLSIIPFFSRRIGLDSNGMPLRIDAGLRLVHQSTDQSFGVMGIKEDGGTSSSASYNFVGRYVKNFGKQNRLGIITTTKIQNENTNIIGGLDGFFRMNKVHSIGFTAMTSVDTQNDELGFGGYLQYRYDTNSVNAWWTQSILDERFKPELGFVSRTNVFATSPGVVANYRGEKLPFKKFLRAYRPRIIGNWFYEASSGKLTEREISISPFWLEAQNGGFFSFTTSFSEQNVSNAFTLLNEEIAVGSYNYTRYNFGIGTDPSGKVSAEMNYEFGDFYNGNLNSWNTSLTIIPIPHIFLSGTINSNSYDSLGTGLNTRTADLYTLESRIFLNPRISLSGLYQRNTQNNSDFYNIRFAWEYNPLSYVFLVFNSNQKNIAEDTFLERQAIVKLSFLKQF